MSFTMLFILLLTLNLSKCLLIKHKLESKYLSLVEESGRTFIQLAPYIEEAIDVTFTPSKNGAIIIRNSKDTSKVFDVAGTSRLNLYKYHGLPNQQFFVSMIDSGKYNIVCKQKCLEFDAATKSILLKPCSNSENQVFEIIDENEKLENPIATGLNYEKYGFVNNVMDPVKNLLSKISKSRSSSYQSYRSSSNY